MSFASLVLSSGAARWFMEAVGFSSLSLLPAVLLHLALNGKPRPIIVSGYLLTGGHFHAFVRAPAAVAHLHEWALWVITIGFGVLTLTSAIRALLKGGKETHGNTSQLLTSMGLLLFVVTFSHFGAGHPPRPWSTELLVHHAGIPVALLILLQDYRFVFLDAFVRFLANVFLAALLALAGIRLAVNMRRRRMGCHIRWETRWLWRASAVCSFYSLIFEGSCSDGSRWLSFAGPALKEPFRIFGRWPLRSETKARI